MALSFVNLPQLPAVHGQSEKMETAAPSNLGDSRVGAGAIPSRCERTSEDLANALRELGRAGEVVSLELRAKNFLTKRS
jgi:hypothetical protein